jgi:hypothetical protein
MGWMGCNGIGQGGTEWNEMNGRMDLRPDFGRFAASDDEEAAAVDVDVLLCQCR